MWQGASALFNAAFTRFLKIHTRASFLGELPKYNCTSRFNGLQEGHLNLPRRRYIR